MLIIHTIGQNQWLRQNVVDGYGNLIFCRDCIVASLGVHTTRLQNQRAIKQKQSHSPVIEMAKKEVIEQHLTDFVLSDDDTLTFGVWWKTLDADEMVEVQYPNERHGLAGRVSNHAKTTVMEQFLEFVDLNSQPNGRQANSYSAQFFFLPKFTRIVTPREGEKNYDMKVTTSTESVLYSEVWPLNNDPSVSFIQWFHCSLRNRAQHWDH